MTTAERLAACAAFAEEAGKLARALEVLAMELSELRDDMEKCFAAHREIEARHPVLEAA